MASDQVLIPIEDGAPETDFRAFRRAMGSFATGVTVVTTAHDGKPIGVTANSFSSVSLEPPLVLWSIDRKSTSVPAFMNASGFAINVLADDQIGLSRSFAKSGPDKFNGVAWDQGARGVPLLTGAAAHFQCRREKEFDGGDHIIMLGRVERFARFDREVLVFSKGRYGLALDHPKGEVTTELPVADRPEGEEPLVLLLFRAYENMAAVHEEIRRAEGLSRGQSRILVSLAANPDESIDELAKATFLDPDSVTDAISALTARGLVVSSPDNRFNITTIGRQQLTTRFDLGRARESKVLSGFKKPEIELARRLLDALGAVRTAS